MICLVVSFLLVFMLCGSKKTTEKKPSEPEKVKPVEGNPTPSPSKPEEPAPKPPAQNEYPPKVEPVKEKSKKKSEKKSEKTHESSRKNWKPGEQEIPWVDYNLNIKCTEVVAEFVKNFADPNAAKCPPCKAFDSHPELNRYKDIKCLDKTRVIIKNGKSDYIHASWIQRPEYERKFILAQSPMNNTVDDFWQMCMENEVKYIVMLCLFVEGGEEQSCQYFPEGEGEKQKYGNIEVELSNKKPHPIDGVIWSVLNVEDLKKSNSQKEINHILVPWWPNKFIPENPKLTAQLAWWLKKRLNPKNSPMVVHCNNGIGRSATFVAISLLRFYVDKDKQRTAVDFIKLLREMRFGAIETEEQYVFFHACVFEYYRSLTDEDKHEYINEDNREDFDRFMGEYNVYARKKIAARKAEMKREKSLKVEPTKDDNFSKEEVKNPKSQKSEGKNEKSSKSKEKPIEKSKNE